MHDVIVVGAGVVGCAIARELARFNIKVKVLEQTFDVAEGATKANSAIVHAGFDATPGSNKARFNVWGNRMFEALCAELGVPFILNGSTVVAFAPEEIVELEKLLERGRVNGVPDLRIIDRDELRQLEPRIGTQAVAALYAPGAGICCPYELTWRLAQHAAINGAEFEFEREVVGIERIEGGWHVKCADGSDHPARTVVNAAGLYSDRLNNLVSAHKIEVKPRRGEYFMIDKAYAGTFKTTVFQAPTPLGKGVLVSPTVDETIVVGPTAEDISDKDDTQTTYEGIDKIFEHARKVWNDLPRSAVITTFAGLRAHGTNGDFVLGEPPDAPGFFNAAAIESPGLTSAPAIGVFLAEKVGSYLQAAPRAEWRAAILPEKAFRHQSAAERAAAIARDARYGQIICRCETIPEAEIRAAIRAPVGARTLDGVKRRTRSGMGRCQGGFCAPRVIAILCDELGVEPEEVTKFGGSSHILTEQ